MKPELKVKPTFRNLLAAMDKTIPHWWMFIVAFAKKLNITSTEDCVLGLIGKPNGLDYEQMREKYPPIDAFVGNGYFGMRSQAKKWVAAANKRAKKDKRRFDLVEQCMSFLDVLVPDWPMRLDMKRLTFSNCADCVLGQLFGMKEGYENSEEWKDYLLLENTFFPGASRPDSSGSYGYNALFGNGARESWMEEIKLRREHGKKQLQTQQLELIKQLSELTTKLNTL